MHPSFRRIQDARTAGNRIIAALPDEDYQRISPYLEVIHLFQRQILYHPGEHIDYAYFPNRSMASLVSILESWSSGFTYQTKIR